MSKKTVKEAKAVQADSNKDAFLSELAELTLKYRLKIGGCGCCGSPFLTELEKNVKSGSYSVCNLDDLRFE